MNTYELSGIALDWAVAEAEYKTNPPAKSWVIEYHKTGQQTWPYSTAWEWGGPIIEREIAKIERFSDALWEATAFTKNAQDFVQDGPTPLVAAMRCYVASRLGDDVQIPCELLSDAI